MAKPIKETPILFGKDAKNFIREAKTTKDKGYVQKERERIVENYNRLKKAETSNRHIQA